MRQLHHLHKALGTYKMIQMRTGHQRLQHYPRRHLRLQRQLSRKPLNLTKKPELQDTLFDFQHHRLHHLILKKRLSRHLRHHNHRRPHKL